MSKSAALIGTVIQIGGFILLFVGIVLIVGLASIFYGNSAGAKVAITGFSLAAGSPILLAGFLVIGFGEIIHLLNRIAHSLSADGEDRK